MAWQIKINFILFPFKTENVFFYIKTQISFLFSHISNLLIFKLNHRTLFLTCNAMQKTFNFYSQIFAFLNLDYRTNKKQKNIIFISNFLNFLLYC